MINMSELHLGALIMDVAAVFMICGIIIHTSIYRRRGRREDWIFFAMSVNTLILAVSDGITYILDGSTLPYAAVLSFICNMIFHIVFESAIGLVTVFLAERYKSSGAAFVGRTFLIMLPAAAMIIMIIANCFVRFLFDVDPVTNTYHALHQYSLILIAPLIYTVISAYLIIRIDIRVLWLFFLMLAIRLVMGRLLHDVSSSALLFAAGLAFIHIHVMGSPFYSEEGL